MKRKIIVAKYAGFCSGVKAAVDRAFSAARQNDDKALYSYGEIIHNESVNRRLAEQGVSVVEDLERIADGRLLIRSHGVTKCVYERAAERGIELIDTTCTYVKRVHKIVQRYDAEGYQVVIIGSANHPEVVGISGWCRDAIVIHSYEEAQRINVEKPLCVVAQTTLNENLYEKISTYLKAKYRDVVIHNTICSATRLRQDEVREIAKKVDYMIVIGGKNSSNTRKLYEISKKICKNAQLIQNFGQIEVKLLENYGNIGIVAGASTPDWIIDEVIQKLKFEGEVVFNGK